MTLSLLSFYFTYTITYICPLYTLQLSLPLFPMACMLHFSFNTILNVPFAFCALPYSCYILPPISYSSPSRNMTKQGGGKWEDDYTHYCASTTSFTALCYQTDKHFEKGRRREDRGQRRTGTGTDRQWRWQVVVAGRLWVTTHGKSRQSWLACIAWLDLMTVL